MEKLNKRKKPKKIKNVYTDAVIVNGNVTKLIEFNSVNIMELKHVYLEKDLKNNEHVSKIILNLDRYLFNILMHTGFIKIGEEIIIKGDNNDIEEKSLLKNVFIVTKWYFINKEEIIMADEFIENEEIDIYHNIDKLVNKRFNSDETKVHLLNVEDFNYQVNKINNEFEYILEELKMWQNPNEKFNNGPKNIYYNRYFFSINNIVRDILYFRMLLKYRLRQIKIRDYKVLHTDNDKNNNLTDENHKLYSLKDIRVTKYCEIISDKNLFENVIYIYNKLTPYYKEILISTFKKDFKLNREGVDIIEIIEGIKGINYDFVYKKLSSYRLWLFVSYLMEEQEVLI